MAVQSPNVKSLQVPDAADPKTSGSKIAAE
jgi:hypothetical protein